jgi:hypothetical protein
VSLKRRLEGLEATQNAAAGYEIPLALEVYFKHLENHRREQVGEPPIPLTPEEERWERETDNDPKVRAYMAQVSKQREE